MNIEYMTEQVEQMKKELAYMEKIERLIEWAAGVAAGSTAFAIVALAFYVSRMGF